MLPAFLAHCRRAFFHALITEIPFLLFLYTILIASRWNHESSHRDYPAISEVRSGEWREERSYKSFSKENTVMRARRDFTLLEKRFWMNYPGHSCALVVSYFQKQTIHREQETSCLFKIKGNEIEFFRSWFFLWSNEIHRSFLGKVTSWAETKEVE